MKKILSMVLVLCMLFAVMLCTSVSAAEDEFRYFCIRIDTEIDIYELSYWVKVNNLLPDVKDYTVEYGKEIEAQYLQYVAEERAEIQADNRKFFEENFDLRTDELLQNSNNRGFILVKSTPKTIASLAGTEGMSVLRDYSNLSSATEFFEMNDSNYYFYEEPFHDPYELVYVMDFYKDTPEPRYAHEAEWHYGGYVYRHLYDYHAEGVASEDEATPDYVLAFAGENVCSPASSAGGFGDRYLLQEYNIYYPYTLGYYIITPEDMQIYTLREAWDAQLEGIEAVFEDYGLGVLRGDSNLDKKINVKDATYIQKCLAELMQFTDDEYVGGFAEKGQGEDGYFFDRVSDMNMDGEVNIKDATSIQKYIAGIEF